MIFVAIIFCERDFMGLARTLDTPFPENVKHIILLDGDMPQKYEIPPKMTELQSSGNLAVFYNADMPETLTKVDAYLREIGADIWFFLRAGDVFHKLYPFYLESFFGYHSDKCGVVTSLLEGEPSCKDGVFAYGGNFPKRLGGTAVWAKSAAEFDASKGADAWLDLVEKIARGKGKFGRLFRVFVTRKNSVTPTISLSEIDKITTVLPIHEKSLLKSSLPLTLNIVKWAYENRHYTITAQISDTVEPETRFLAVIDTNTHYGDFNTKSGIVTFVLNCDAETDVRFYRTTVENALVPLNIFIAADAFEFKSKTLLPFIGEEAHIITLRKYSSRYEYERTSPDGTMNMMFSFDERLARYAPVTMISLYRNHPNRKIDIYVVYFSLSEYSISLIRRTAEQYSQKVHFIQCGDGDDYSRFRKYSNTFECYFDLFAHIYLPQNIKRVLYLDVDLYVNKDISELYFDDFDGAWLIGIADCGNALRTSGGETDPMKLAAGGQGFNSGVLVLDLEKFREAGVCIDDYNKLIDELNERGIDYFGDQALFNVFMLDKPVKYLSPLYNFLWLEHDAQNEGLREYDFEDVFIFHCGGNEYKPWAVRLDMRDIALYNGNVYIKKHRITERVVLINQGWWNYAKYAPNYNQLCLDAISYKHFLSVVNFKLIDSWKHGAGN